MDLNPKPKLSVLMPAYNAGKYIRDSVASILNQSFVDFELLIANDGSSDDTINILESVEDPRIRIFDHKENHGKNKVCEMLLEVAQGNYITVHDADDISLKDRFSRQLEFLEDNQQFALCGTGFISFFNNGNIFEKRLLESDPLVIRDKIRKSSQFHGPTTIFKKEILEEIGGLYRYFVRAEDIDFTMRVAEKFFTTNIEDYLYLYRLLPNSLTNNVASFNLERKAHGKMLYYLAEQRRTSGRDLLMENEIYKVNQIVEKFKEELENNEFIDESIARLMTFGFYRSALALVFQFIFKYPFKFTYWRILAYIIKIIPIKLLTDKFKKWDHIRNYT